MTMCTLEQILDLARTESSVRYDEGYTAGLEAGSQRQASEWAELTAAALDEQAHESAAATVAAVAGGPVSHTFASIGIDPITADADTLRQCAQFWREQERLRVRAHVAGAVVA